jgi:pyrroline-5-carboxylate reductase
MNIAIVGGGNMGEAIASILINNQIIPARNVIVSRRNTTELLRLKRQYDISVTSDNVVAIKGADIVILSVKPQNLLEVMKELNGHLKPRQLLLSIIAGAKIESLRSGTGHKRIVRVMPNTPARIGEGISIWTTSSEVTENQKEWSKRILGTMGKEIYVDDEKYLDMATAISGSGPAYFFLFTEVLINAAQDIGLSQNMAKNLVIQTIFGSGHLLHRSGRSSGELRKMVATSGGATAEALARFEQGNFRNLVISAVSAAYNKAIELGNN